MLEPDLNLGGRTIGCGRAGLIWEEDFASPLQPDYCLRE